MITYKQRKVNNTKTIDLLARYLKYATTTPFQVHRIKTEIKRLRDQQFDYRCLPTKRRCEIIPKSTLIIESKMNYEDRN